MLFFSPVVFLSYRTWVALGAPAKAFQWLWGWRRRRHSLVAHGRWAAGSASGDEAPRLSEGAVHKVSGSLPTAQQTLPARRNPNQGHAGKTLEGICKNCKPKSKRFLSDIWVVLVEELSLDCLWCFSASDILVLFLCAKKQNFFVWENIALSFSKYICTVIFHERHMIMWSVSYNFICHPFCFICMSKYHWGLKEDWLGSGTWWISSLGLQIELFLVVLRTIQSLSLSTEKICHIILSQAVLCWLLGRLTKCTPTKFPPRIRLP